MTESTRARFYRIVSLSFAIGGLLTFAVRYLIYRAPLGPVLLFSVSMLVIGLALLWIRKINVAEKYQDDIFTVLIAFSIPVIMYGFMEKSATSVWAIPFVFLMLSVIFNKCRMLVIIALTAFLAQGWMWVRIPEITLTITGADHLARMIILGLTVMLAFFVNRTYIHRIEENEAQTDFQKMISQISTNFVTVSVANLDEKINEMLEMVCRYYQVDRVRLFRFSRDQKAISCTHQWCLDNSEQSSRVPMELPVDTFPWLLGQVLENKSVYILDTASITPEALAEMEVLRQGQQVRSLIAIPVTNKGKLLGFLGFESVRRDRGWRKDHQKLLNVPANLLADALVKVEAEKEINFMAYYDALTGLPNRALYKDRLEQAIHLARRTEKFIGVMFIDLDSFKAVNDTMGHEGGDALLLEVAKRLIGSVRKYDTVSRFGGDEFLIMFPQVPRSEDIQTIAETIMHALGAPLIINSQEFFITASAGISVYPADGEEAETLIKNADLAMYNSKDSGKNQYTLCSPVLKEDVLKKMQLTNSLYRALEKNELVLYYQPQVSIATKEIIGIEALIRWIHPELGMISPGVFIPLAEQTGLINPIGHWVLRTACRQNKEWQDMGLSSIRMAVNLSVEQFRDPNLARIVDHVLRETGLEPRYIELEITESTAVKEADYIIRVLLELKALGVTISIDDFGTEYSSLSRLKMLPIDRIKMAMQFVHGISTNTKDEAIAKIIIHLARNLGLKVIAEGVETENQLSFLSKRICDDVQGYFFYKPMPAEEVEAILKRSESSVSEGSLSV